MINQKELYIYLCKKINKDKYNIERLSFLKGFMAGCDYQDGQNCFKNHNERMETELETLIRRDKFLGKVIKKFKKGK